MNGNDQRRPVTATDVARAAKVSQSTVSLVLNGKWQGRIREDTARRVMRTADDLGYRINQSARNLRLGSTGTVLLAVPTLVNPVFATVHAGAARVGASNGLGIVVFPLSAEDGFGPFPTPRQALDGVIACSLSAHAVSNLRTGLPLVVLDDAPVPDTPTVTMDTGGGMAKALAHLTALGHRRILHLRAERPAWTFTRRAEAFDQCILSHPQVTADHLSCSFAIEEIRDRTIQALSVANRPTAIVCDDDNMALSIYAAASALDLTIGRDLSVIGFNDLPTAALATPPLTTVRLPLGALGFRGMQALIDLRGGVANDPVTLPTELVIRKSTGPAPATT
ncbi:MULTISPECIES: LacI family DNA-binding transcriptional regulator [Kitasatospora]|uniref:LacI family DNA-binding transcriptional regulator n=1 Tax=Kitasatospora cystarginea TaxID=58350 RepID=A0ABP5QM24_9ACTN